MRLPVVNFALVVLAHLTLYTPQKEKNMHHTIISACTTHHSFSLSCTTFTNEATQIELLGVRA